jgi:hypothetical protein
MAWHGQIFAQGEVNVFRKVSLLEINQRVSGPAIVAVFTKVGEALFHDRHSLFSFLSVGKIKPFTLRVYSAKVLPNDHHWSKIRLRSLRFEPQRWRRHHTALLVDM